MTFEIIAAENGYVVKNQTLDMYYVFQTLEEVVKHIKTNGAKNFTYKQKDKKDVK